MGGNRFTGVDRIVIIVVGAIVLLVAALSLSAGAWEASRLVLAGLAAGVAYALVRGCLSLRGGLLTAIGWVGSMAAVAAFLLTLFLLFGSGGSASPAGSSPRLLLLLGLVAVLVADGAFVVRCRLRHWLPRGAAALALLSLGVVVVLSLQTVIQADWSAFGWITPGGRSSSGTMLLLMAAGLLAHLTLPSCGRWERDREAARMAGMPDRALATLQCPRCEQWLQMRSGFIACPGCALAIRFEFNEPRCRCGYPLHRLSGSRCPECGREVPSGERWGRAARTGGEPVTAAPPPPSPPSA